MDSDDRTRIAPPDAFPPSSDDPSTVARRSVVPDTVVHHPDPDDTRPPDFRAADTPPAADAPLAPFAQFRPIDELGRGGMGVVYRALDTDFMRDVAVKVLSERLVGNRTAVRRFLEEARVTGQLTHTAIPAVHQMGTLPDGRPFLAMKLIKGRTLAEMLKARPDPSADLTRFLDILEKVCEGVGYAHAHGVMHRDLKPGNIMVGAFGEVQVMDWGLAREVRTADAGEADETDAAADPPPHDGTVLREVRFADEEYTRAGTVLGTPAYMAPEQAAADPDAIDVRADVFGLGAILCTVLTGLPPYPARDVNSAVLMALRWDIADAFRRLGHCKAEPEVIALCQRCLAKNPADRPANGKAVADELARLRATAAERVKKADLKRMAEIAKRSELKKRVWLGAGLGAAVLVILGLVGFGLWSADAQARTLASEKAKAEAKEEDDRAEQRRKDADAAREKLLERGRLESGIRAALGEVDAALKDVTADTDVDVWNVRIATAQERQRRAEESLRTVGDPALGPEVEAAGNRVKAAVQARDLMVTLENIASRYLERVQVGERNRPVASYYADVFRPFPLDRPAEFATRVNAHPAPAALLEGLFDWYANTDSDGDRDRLRAVIDATVVPDSFLARWWAAQKKVGPDGTQELLTLAAEAADGKPIGWVIHRVFCDLWSRGARNAAVRLMRAGLLHLPGDYRLNARFALHLAVLNTPAAREEAVRHALVAVALRPKSVDVLVLLGRLLGEGDDPAAGLPYLDRAIGLEGDDVNTDAHLQRAAVHLRMNNPKLAEQDYLKISRQDPTAEGRLGIIRARWADGTKRAEAVADLRKFFPNVPQSGDSQLALARTCQAMYLEAEAINAYRAAIKAAPKALNTRLLFARYLRELADDRQADDRVKKLREAETVLREATEHSPTSFIPHVDLVLVYSRLGDPTKGLAAAEKAADLGKGVSEAEWVLGYAQSAAGKYADATATAVTFVKNYPEDARGPFLLGHIAFDQSKWADAIPHFQRSVELNPRHADALNMLALSYGYCRDYANAVKAMKRAVELEPDSAILHFNLATWLTANREPLAALTHAARAAELNPALKGRKAEAPKPPSK